MLLTDFIHQENHQHNGKNRQHDDYKSMFRNHVFPINNSTFKNKIFYYINNIIRFMINYGGRHGSSTNVKIIMRFESYRMIRYEIRRFPAVVRSRVVLKIIDGF